jgi:secreted trypsin-like serine protease
MASVKKPLLLLLVVLALFAVGGAQAITYGQPDGNKHPNVGAMLRLREHDAIFPDDLYRIVCSGSLIAPRVFLTASHCTSFVESFDPPYNEAWVTFDPTFTSSTTLPASAIHGTMYTNPAYSQRQSDPGDIAVIILDQPVNGVTYAQMPTAGLLDQMSVAGTLKSAQFTNVGYGTQEPEPGPGGITNAFPMERWYSVSSFWALTPSWLLLNQNNAAGSAGTCSGDSGGPQFLGAGTSETNTQTSITIKGDVFCFATNWVYRLDTQPARDFLAQFASYGVVLP